MPRRHAFTLLEVLLALALGSVVMVGLFSMLHVQGRIARDGGRVVEEAQLARGLLEQIAEDVRTSIRPAATAATAFLRNDEEQSLIDEGMLSPHPPTPGRTLPTPFATMDDDLPLPLRTLAAHSDRLAVGLYGDAECLVVSGGNADLSRSLLSEQSGELARTTVNLQLPTGSPDSRSTSLGATVGSANRAVRTARQASSGTPASFALASAGVAYFAVRDRTASEVSDLSEAFEGADGLARLELARCDPEIAVELLGEAMQSLRAVRVDEHSGADLGDEPLPPEEGETRRAGDTEDVEDERAFTVPGLHAEVVAPEVRWVRFRYLGRYGWQETWTSLAELPRAVEIAAGLAGDETQPRDSASPTEKQALEEPQDRTTTSVADDTKEGLAGTQEFAFESPYPEAVTRAGLHVYRLVVWIPAAAGGRMSVWAGERDGFGVARGLGTPKPQTPSSTAERRLVHRFAAQGRLP